MWFDIFRNLQGHLSFLVTIVSQYYLNVSEPLYEEKTTWNVNWNYFEDSLIKEQTKVYYVNNIYCDEQLLEH